MDPTRDAKVSWVDLRRRLARSRWAALSIQSSGDMKDYYKILELEFGASQERIREQHRFLLHAWHPDKFPTSDQKYKAVERVKEINEAYSILGDQVKREKYDNEFRPIISPAPKPTTPKPTSTQAKQSHPAGNFQQHCESCGLPTETKFVEFYENVGALILRYHRSIKGNFCKPCIDHFFWNLTGKTMLLGWWGIISFIITPFILLNNLFRYIFTLGMKKPPLHITPSPSPIWVFSTIGGFLLIGFLLFSMFFPTFAQPINSPSATRTPKTIPTRTPIVRKTPTSPASNCIRWSQVTRNHVGRKICVYGKSYAIYYTDEASTRINFTSEPNTFFLYDPNYIYPDLKEGDCVVAEEYIQLFDNNIPYMAVSDLYFCESWMK